MLQSKCPTVLHLQQYFSYTMEVSIYRHRKPKHPEVRKYPMHFYYIKLYKYTLPWAQIQHTKVSAY